MTQLITCPDRAAGKFAFLALAFWFTFASPPHANAQEISWNGFVQAHAAARIRSVDCPTATECRVPSNELRAELETAGSNAAGNARFFGRFDFLGDFALGKARLESRELYGDLKSEALGARLGRQVITWGVGDLLFINDTFPRDPVALFTGQPVQYYKRGSDALKLNAYSEPANVELVIASFRPDNIPTKRQFLLNDPLPATLPRRTQEPGTRPKDLEISARVYRYLDSWEVAGYASRTHFHSPGMRVVAGTAIASYPRLNTLGASLSGAALGGVLSLEAGYYDSPQDRSGRDPSVENSQLRSLIGYSRQPWEDATLGLQLYTERMRNYLAYRETLPTGFTPKRKVRDVLTFRFTQLFDHQTVAFNVFAFIGLSERDHYVISSLRYTFSDKLWAEVGVNLFGGNRQGTYGAMRDNGNAYVTVRHTF
jgi:hypothetical protein